MSILSERAARCRAGKPFPALSLSLCPLGSPPAAAPLQAPLFNRAPSAEPTLEASSGRVPGALNLIFFVCSVVKAELSRLAATGLGPGRAVAAFGVAARCGVQLPPPSLPANTTFLPLFLQESEDGIEGDGE